MAWLAGGLLKTERLGHVFGLAEIAGAYRPCLANLRQKLLKGRRGINTLQWWMLTDFASVTI